MLNLLITKPLLQSKNSELVEDDKAKLAVFISNFSSWKDLYKEHLNSPVTYEQVRKLHFAIGNQLEAEGPDGHSMLDQALAALN
jgi:hypothetical protein